MTKIDIISGFLGAGKTTLIKKLIQDALAGEKVVLIENEFGEIGIDGGFMSDAGIVVNELNSGCICCSLTGDFRAALSKVIAEYSPERIIIEPSGVGKLSEIVNAVNSAKLSDVVISGLATVVDASHAKVYRKNFGEFFEDQIKAANCVILSRTGIVPVEKTILAEQIVHEDNPSAIVVTTDWKDINGKDILAAIEKNNTIGEELARMMAEHEDECDDPECSCHHHHHHDGDECEHEHHHHHHDEDEHEHHHHHDEDEHEHHHHHDEDEHEHHHHHDEDEHEHHHHHDEDEHEHHHHHDEDEHEHHHHHDEDEHEHHHHHHHHDHDADEVFQSWGKETSQKFTKESISQKLDALQDEEKFGMIIRAKGYVESPDGSWIHFDYTPGEKDLRDGSAGLSGRICVIGAGLKEDAVKELFRFE